MNTNDSVAIHRKTNVRETLIPQFGSPCSSGTPARLPVCPTQKREQARQIPKSQAPAGVGIFQRATPGQLAGVVGEPEPKQVGHIRSLYYFSQLKPPDFSREYSVPVIPVGWWTTRPLPPQADKAACPAGPSARSCRQRRLPRRCPHRRPTGRRSPPSSRCSRRARRCHL